jgi:Dihydrodipicolinate reductase, N-terminus/short chain dehydrogenase
MTIRVVHCGTGLTGREALRAIIGDPRLELVGQYVSTPEKVGKDAGDLCGLAPTGVIATGDLDAVVALGADCLCYVRERRELHDMSRTVLVSGATRGVGRGIADAFARRGDRLVVVGRSTDANPNKVGLPGTLEGVAAELRAAGADEVLTIAADLARTEEADASSPKCAGRRGPRTSW